MDNIDDFFHESHYNIIRVLLSVSGLWPYDTAVKRYAIFIVLLLILGSGLAFEVLGIVDIWSDSFAVVDSLPLLTLGALSLIKLIYAVYTLPKIKTLLTKMHVYWYSAKSDEERKILHSYSLHGRNLGYAYAGILLSHTAFFVLTSLLSKLFHVESSNKNDTSDTYDAPVGLTHRVNYMVDVDTYYVPIFIHTATCDASYSILLVTFDVLYLTLVQHCCGLFAALRYRLESVLKIMRDNSDDTIAVAAGITYIRKDISHSNIVYSVRRHAEVIQFATMLESMYRVPLLIHVGANISVLSVLGFQVITSTQNINRILKHIIYFSALLLNTFFENWQGQKMINSSEKVYNSAYNAQWYRMPIVQRKLFIMIMMRSKTPLTITAGKFVVLSYVNFNAVLRAASSYFMVLRSMQ